MSVHLENPNEPVFVAGSPSPTNSSSPVVAAAQAALPPEPLVPNAPLSPEKVKLLGAPTASTKAATTYYWLVQIAKVLAVAGAALGVMGALGMAHVLPGFSGLGLGNIGLIVPGALLFTPLGVAMLLAIGKKLSGEKVREELRDGLAEATLTALRKLGANNTPLFSSDRFDPILNKYPSFKEDLAILRDIINDPVPDKGARFSKITEFHEAYNRIALSDEYLQMPRDNDLVQLMEQLAVTVCEEVDGLAAYRNFGNSCLGKLRDKPENNEFLNQQNVTTQKMGTLADILEKGLEHPPFAAHRRDTVKQKALWVSAHTDSFRDSARSETQGIDFRNSVPSGNMLSAGWSYDKGGKKIFTLFGPGTPEPIIENWMRAKLEAGETVLYQNVQHYTRKGEDKRINRFLEWAQKYPNFHMVSTPMDGEYWKMKHGKQEFVTPKEFLYGSQGSAENPQGYRAFAATDPTFFTSSNSDKTAAKTTDTAKKDVAFKFAEQAFTQAYDEGENSFWQQRVLEGDKGKARLGKMMQLGIDGFVAIGEIERELDNAKNNTTKQKSPCKQQIDRGAVMAALTTILFDYAHDKCLTEERINEIEGVLVGRAILVEGRMPQEDRYEPLLDLLRFFSGNEAQLINTLKGFLGQYSRIPESAPAVA